MHLNFKLQIFDYLISAVGQSTAANVPNPLAAFHKPGNRFSKSFIPFNITSPAL